MRRDEVLRLLGDHRTDLERLGVKHLSLYGSVARDEARPDSDVDLLVEFDRPVGLFELVDVKDYLERLLGRPVHLGTRDGLKPRMPGRILREAVPLHAPGPAVGESRLK